MVQLEHQQVTVLCHHLFQIHKPQPPSSSSAPQLYRFHHRNNSSQPSLVKSRCTVKLPRNLQPAKSRQQQLLAWRGSAFDGGCGYGWEVGWEVKWDWGQLGREETFMVGTVWERVWKMFSVNRLFFDTPYAISYMIHHSTCHILIYYSSHLIHGAYSFPYEQGPQNDTNKLPRK